MGDGKWAFVRRLIMHESDLIVPALYDQPWMWTAAHAIPPSAGQGAAQAFEDGELLARVLAEGGTFEAYQAERSKRISLITAMTKDSGDLRKTGSAGGFAFFIKKSFMKVYFHFFASGRGSAIYLYDSTEVPIR